MKVLITGGAGFIGQHLAQRLTARGDAVCAIDVLLEQVHIDPESSAARFPGAVVRGDVADEATWQGLPDFDAVVHLAAETGTAQSMYERERYERVNVRGTLLAARAAVRLGATILVLSSRAVYGEGLVENPQGAPEDAAHDRGAVNTLRPSHEDDPHRPVSFYGETKSDAEWVLTETAGGVVPVTVIRPQNVIGPGQALHNPYTGVLAAFLARLRERRPLSIYGDGTQTRDFVHVSDLVDLIVWNLDNPPQLSQERVLNCGTGIRTTLTDLARYAITASPVPDTVIEYVPVHRAGDIDHACADIGRLRVLGAPLPRLSTKQAVADFITEAWNDDSAPSAVWDRALDELTSHGLAERQQPGS